MKKNEGLKIKFISPLKLKPYETNPRLNEKAVDQCAASITAFGFANPISVDKDLVVICGHTRLKASLKLELETVPVIILSDLTPEKVLAYRLADNKVSELSEWDEDMLALELEKIDDLDMSIFGFEFKEEKKPVDPDLIAKPPKKPVTKIGDIWTLGKHRLLCGDSTSEKDFLKLTDGVSPDLCFTDPPYGVGLEYDTHEDSQDGLKKLIDGFFPIVKKYCRTIAITPGTRNVFLYERPDWILCWFTGSGVAWTAYGFSCWQPFLLYGKDPKLSDGEGSHPDGFQLLPSGTDNEQKNALDHSCPKPFSVWLRFLERFTTKKTKTIYDPFTGSGTSIVCAEELGLQSFGMEISPNYCDVIVDRWQRFTGKKAMNSRGNKASIKSLIEK